VASVKKVSAIVAEISAASAEQSLGIQQVSRAIAHMDQMTQQNAALVEQAAAASESMNEQATQVHQLMSFFRVAHGGDEAGSEAQARQSRPGPVAAPLAQHVERRAPGRPWSGKPAKPAVPAVSAAANGTDDEWEEF
jgi:hypothetical protein